MEPSVSECCTRKMTNCLQQGHKISSFFHPTAALGPLVGQGGAQAFRILEVIGCIS